MFGSYLRRWTFGGKWRHMTSKCQNRRPDVMHESRLTPLLAPVSDADNPYRVYKKMTSTTPIIITTMNTTEHTFLTSWTFTFVGFLSVDLRKGTFWVSVRPAYWHGREQFKGVVCVSKNLWIKIWIWLEKVIGWETKRELRHFTVVQSIQ